MVMVGESNKRATDQLTIESAESTDRNGEMRDGWVSVAFLRQAIAWIARCGDFN